MKFIDLQAQYANIRAEINNNIQGVLDHGQYINGPEVGALEKKLGQYIGSNDCIGVSSGTDALTISLMALNVQAGDEVIMPGFTYIATAETAAFLGAKPVFVDIDPLTFNIDPSQIEAAITPKTKAIMAVSLYGQCADFEAINAVASKHNLPVIEDGAQSFGATYHGKKSCGLTTIGTTSFFPSKPLGGYGDGGAIFTSDPELAKACRQIRAHGEESRYHHARVGMNGRLDAIQAAILLAKMDVFEGEVESRQTIAGRYIEQLGKVDGIILPQIQPHNRSVFAQFTLRVRHRDSFRASLQEAGIPTAVHYPMPVYKQPAYKVDAISLEQCERASSEVISLPFSPWMSTADQDQVIAAVVDAAQAMPS